MVHLIKNNKFSSNTYLLIDDKKGNCIIIDPGLDELIIDKEIQKLDLNPIAILSTHGHFDHIGGVTYFKNRYSIPFYMHEADVKISKSANFYLKMTGIDHKIAIPTPDFLFKGEHEKVSIGDFSFEIYNFPGHSNGSSVFQHNVYLFTGDIIYKKGLGFNNFPGEDVIKLKQSVIKIFNIFPDNSIVYPGHGNSECLGLIKKNNSELIDFLYNQ